MRKIRRTGIVWAVSKGIKKTPLFYTDGAFSKKWNCYEILEDFLDCRSDAADKNPGVGKAALEPAGLGSGGACHTDRRFNGLLEGNLEIFHGIVELFFICRCRCN